MSLLDIGPVIFGDTDGIITYSRTHGLLSQGLNCIRQKLIKKRLHTLHESKECIKLCI